MRSLLLCSLLLLARAAFAGPPLPSQLQAMVDAAVAAGARRFVIPPTDAGGYFFSEANFTVTDATDFELDGALPLVCERHYKHRRKQGHVLGRGAEPRAAAEPDRSLPVGGHVAPTRRCPAGTASR